MSLLSELKALIEAEKIPVETGVFTDKAPDSYVVLTPIVDTFGVFSDNRPQNEIQEVRISLFDKGSYTAKKNRLVRTLLEAELTITDRRYIGHEDDTGYHHYAIDVANNYEMEET